MTLLGVDFLLFCSNLLKKSGLHNLPSCTLIPTVSSSNYCHGNLIQFTLISWKINLQKQINFFINDPQCQRERHKVYFISKTKLNEPKTDHFKIINLNKPLWSWVKPQRLVTPQWPSPKVFVWQKRIWAPSWNRQINLTLWSLQDPTL